MMDRLAERFRVVREPPHVEVVIENLDREDDVAVGCVWERDRRPTAVRSASFELSRKDGGRFQDKNSPPGFHVCES